MFCLFYFTLAALNPSSVSKQVLPMAAQWQIVSIQPLPLLLTEQGQLVNSW